MRIAILGAGGIGAYVGARLAVAGEDVAFLARGAHLAAMQRDGLRIESQYGNLHLSNVEATNDPAAIGPVDLVLFTVKLWDAETAAAALSPLIAPNTRVVTLQNGVDGVDIVARHMPLEQVLGGVIYLPAVIAEPGFIRTTGELCRIIVDKNNGNEVIEAFRASSERAVALEVELGDPIGPAIWEKFIIVASMSAATSLMRSPAGPILANAETRAFVRQLVDEGVAMAAATGNTMQVDFAAKAMAFYDTLLPAHQTSMSNDLANGRPLEVQWLSGRVHSLGLQHRIPTPAHTAAYRGLILHASGSKK